MYNHILHATAHRNHALPSSPWLMTQKWEHLLFIHLPLPKETVKPHIPDGLELDTFNGKAWISILPFKVSNMHFRLLPPIPFTHSFLELNVRTYVTRGNKKGVYFFSLDANNLPSVLGARILALPYFYARMNMIKEDKMIYYESKQVGKSHTSFKGSYQPVTEPYYPKENSLSHWLLENYFLWADRGNSLYRGDIHHKPWKIQDANAQIEKQHMMPAFVDDTISDAPIYQYVYSKRVFIWPIKKVQ